MRPSLCAQSYLNTLNPLFLWCILIIYIYDLWGVIMYDERSKERTLSYLKKQKQFSVFFQQKEYTELIRPAIEASGLGPTVFIKKAVRTYANDILSDAGSKNEAGDESANMGE